jgi:hypothetical protein
MRMFPYAKVRLTSCNVLTLLLQYGPWFLPIRDYRHVGRDVSKTFESARIN